MTLQYSVYKPCARSAYLPLPDCVANTKSCVNVKNEDVYCFKYAVLCAVHKVHEKKMKYPNTNNSRILHGLNSTAWSSQ